jgi:adenine/guanine phosphoribosyltransferase-like PRPP-binding protein
MKDIYSGYLSRPLAGGISSEKLINQMAKMLAPIWFDAIAFRGMSGALIAPSVAAILDKPLIMVRKSTNNTHSWRKVEGFMPSIGMHQYVIIDDFIASGNTIKDIIRDIRNENTNLECLGVATYLRNSRYFSKTKFTRSLITQGITGKMVFGDQSHLSVNLRP